MKLTRQLAISMWVEIGNNDFSYIGLTVAVHYAHTIHALYCTHVHNETLIYFTFFKCAPQVEMEEYSHTPKNEIFTPSFYT